MKIAVFPGSFDPITMGHVDVVTRCLPLFDKIIIGIGTNASKQYLFSQQQREDFIKESFKGVAKIACMHYEKLTVEFCKKQNAQFIIRGLRNSTDFDFETSIAQMNRALSPQIETLFIPCSPQLIAISSTIVRDIIRNGGNAQPFLNFKL
ncbi:MAG TPA: pantetheine-phosphate adenylyltransferase [Bacteroidia bacterium]|nr:pantetheine-phosphate adenylyltransferase [Bacteroidia bacterium]